MLEQLASPLAAIAIILAILFPLWFFWLLWRIGRHLYHISTALFQIRDELRKRNVAGTIDELKPIVDRDGRQLFP